MSKALPLAVVLLLCAMASPTLAAGDMQFGSKSPIDIDEARQVIREVSDPNSLERSRSCPGCLVQSVTVGLRLLLSAYRGSRLHPVFLYLIPVPSVR